MKILINCTGKFCYWHGNFQKTEAARGVFKSLTKFTRKHLWRVWWTPGLWSATLLKKRLRQMFFCELCEIFKNTFFASDCFSKYESLYIIATIHSCLIKSCHGNVRTISRNISVLDCNFQETSSVKLKIGWIHIMIKISYRKTSKISSRAYIFQRLL